MGHHVYEPRAGIPAAVDLRAIGASYAERDRASRSYEMRRDAAIVSVSGPLEQHEGDWCDSYDAIKSRIASAIAAKPSCIVLALDTPGGSAQGCIEASRDIRAMVRGAGIPLVAWTDTMACSAGYALAAAADRIVVAPSAIIGSIGTVTGRLDLSKAIEDKGARYALITSGARKADGHPALAITPEETAATQTLVDDFASMFFGWVHESRGLSVAAIRSLEAGVFVGAQAIEAGIADQVGTLDDAIASVRRKGNGATSRGRHQPTRAQGKHRMAADWSPKVGDRVRVREGKAHDEMTADAEGEVAEISDEYALAIRFDGMDALHRWYVASEIERADDNAGAANARRLKETRMTVRAEMESCDLAKLRDAMEMPDQPAQEVCDAAADRIAAEDAGEGEVAPAAEEAKALRAQIAAQTAAIEALRADLAAAHVALEPLKAIAAAKAEADRVARVDALMKVRGMPTHKADGSPTERREDFQKVAREHGEPAAEAAIKASHVPPTGTVAAPPPPEHRASGAPEGASGGDVTDPDEATAIARAAIETEQPGLKGPALFTAVLARARKDHPRAFSRSAAKN